MWEIDGVAPGLYDVLAAAGDAKGSAEANDIGAEPPRPVEIELRATTEASGSIVDMERSLVAERDLGRKLLTLAASRDRSAVDGASYRAYEAAMLLPAAGRLDVELSVGHGRSTASDAGWYAGLLFLVYGGR